MIVELITPDELVFSGEADVTTLPGSDGSFQLLKDHAALVSSLEKGTVVIKSASEEKKFIISGGVVEVQLNKAIILAESLDQIDK